LSILLSTISAHGRALKHARGAGRRVFGRAFNNFGSR